MHSLRAIVFSLLVTATWASAQSTYTDEGRWIGLRGGYVPSGKTLALTGMYEWRFDRYWSASVDLTGLNMSGGYTFLIAAGLRLRIPLFRYNRNLYGHVGLGSGSLYPVLIGALGFEYGLTERVSVFAQYRRYTANFDHLRPYYAVYSIGLNFDITPPEERQSCILGK